VSAECRYRVQDTDGFFFFFFLFSFSSFSSSSSSAAAAAVDLTCSLFIQSFLSCSFSSLTGAEFADHPLVTHTRINPLLYFSYFELFGGGLKAFIWPVLEGVFNLPPL